MAVTASKRSSLFDELFDTDPRDVADLTSYVRSVFTPTLHGAMAVAGSSAFWHDELSETIAARRKLSTPESLLRYSPIQDLGEESIKVVRFVHCEEDPDDFAW